MLETFRFAVNPDPMELNDELGAGIINGEDHVPNGQYTDVEFLFELSASGIENTLARFQFAAGEFPKTAMPLVIGALADEIAVAPLYDSCNNARFDNVSMHDTRRGARHPPSAHIGVDGAKLSIRIVKHHIITMLRDSIGLRLP